MDEFLFYAGNGNRRYPFVVFLFPLSRFSVLSCRLFSFFSPTFTFSVHMVWVGFYWFTFLFIMGFWSISHSTVFLLQLAFAWLGLLVIFVSCILTEFDCHWVLVGTPGKT